ncbi:hypothetical protein F5883DRAFT_575749 [Diaporthe sp. PMI_573]|nr:hypothetical protein F5883DRAFT_575749 [Diaporthaceae sp. PMI_573]
MEHREDRESIQCLQDRLHESLGSSFWQNHEESAQLLQWVRTVEAIHNWLEETKAHYGRLIQHNRETKILHLPDSYTHKRFGEVSRHLDAMDPYLPKTLRNGTYYEGLEDITRRITDELWSGNVYWLDCFSRLIGAVLLDHDEWLSELITPLGESLQPIRVDQNRVVDLRSRGERGDLAPDGRRERFLWPGIVLIFILLITLG